VAVANGSALHILGYIEVVVAVPSLAFELPVPVLVVPDTAGSQSCPVNLGTNVIRRCKSAVPHLFVQNHWSLHLIYLFVTLAR